MAGEAIAEQWHVSRDLYVIVRGTVEVSADGNTLATLGPGEFFGELSAIDWGAGFARTRSATVTATEATLLLVLDWVLVNWIMKAMTPVSVTNSSRPPTNRLPHCGGATIRNGVELRIEAGQLPSRPRLTR